MLAAVDRDGTMATAPGVIFSGSPAQIVNLPTCVKAAAGAIVVLVAYPYALMRWPVPWFVPLGVSVPIAPGAVIAYLRTAFTEIMINTVRITCRQGILDRRLQSLELFRIQDVTSVHPWRQRPFGIGTVPATVPGRWFHLYLILDLYSRKIVGRKVQGNDAAEHARIWCAARLSLKASQLLKANRNCTPTTVRC